MAIESIGALIGYVFITLCFFQVVTYMYNVFLHPLRKYPGPKLSAASSIPLVSHLIRGDPVHWTTKIHDDYGSDVVRVAPNELSYRDPRAWKEIYGHRKAGQPALAKNQKLGSIDYHNPVVKADTSSLTLRFEEANHVPYFSPHFYKKPFEGDAANIIDADDETHSRMRRIFSNAFSDRSLKQQEPLFLTYVDKLMSLLRRTVEKNKEEKFDMVKMYNFTTFDVMGDITFGEPLGLLENSEFTPWVASMFNNMIFGAYLHSIRYFPAVEKLLLKCMPKSLNEKRKQHDRHSSDRVDKRLKQTSSKPDIWNLILKRDEASGLSLGEMHSNASIFMLAGTETTATLLSGLTFYLLKSPDKLKTLTDEIRGACKSDEDLTLETLAGLKYLHACLEEGLRMYPPVPNGLARIVPAGGLEICGQYVPPKTSIYVTHFAMYRNPRNFRDPYSFIPERWISAEYESDVKSALQPFSVGPRNCLGKNLAYHEMRLILAKTLWHFDLSLCSESERWADQKTYVLWSKGPLLCKITPVER